MVKRSIKVSKNSSMFIFGARGTGKTTFAKEHFINEKALWIDLLKEEDEEQFARHPDNLSAAIASGKPTWVVIDEVQKCPKLLDIVHLEIEKKKTKFVLTGSSARKLKRGGADLLAGRAFTYNLHPLTYLELADKFNLDDALRFGTLPKLLDFFDDNDKNEFLKAYVKTYLREEILMEQIIRKVDAFKDFLPILAQNNGEILNYSKIARDVGVDYKTVESYYQIIEDTLIGFRLPAYHKSIRKQQTESPKYYLFDLGVKRALEQSLRADLTPHSYGYGRAFEHFLVVETMRLNDYLRLDYQFSYLKTKDGAEIDLVITRPGDKTLLVEIKSATTIHEEDCRTLNRFIIDWPSKNIKGLIWSRDPIPKKFNNVYVLPWRDGLASIYST